MSKTHIPIFATTDDWLDIVAGVDSTQPLQLVRTGLFDTSRVETQSNPFKLDSLAGYLVLDKSAEVSVRDIQQRNGGTKYAVDQLDNANSVVLQIGGLVDQDRLVSGSIGTIRSDHVPKELFKLFAELINERFKNIKSYFVGPEALRLLRAGTRLSPTRKSPREYDLIE
jgi:hypothetical protein